MPPDEEADTAAFLANARQLTEWSVAVQFTLDEIEALLYRLIPNRQPDGTPYEVAVTRLIRAQNKLSLRKFEKENK